MNIIFFVSAVLVLGVLAWHFYGRQAGGKQAERPLVFIFLGPPGSGKGTQAQKIAEFKKIPHISTGEMIRQHIADATQLGLEAKAIVESGGYVSDDLIVDMLFERLSHQDCARGYLLDGFPRTLHQAEKFCAHFGEKIQLKVIHFKIDDEELVARLAGRLTCRSCGAVAHRLSAPPAKEGVCDVCGGSLYQREDDKEEAVRERLKVYKEKSAPLVDFFDQKKVLLHIDAAQPREKILEFLQKSV